MPPYRATLAFTATGRQRAPGVHQAQAHQAPGVHQAQAGVWAAPGVNMELRLPHSLASAPTTTAVAEGSGGGSRSRSMPAVPAG
jgi:hypothetical protein